MKLNGIKHILFLISFYALSGFAQSDSENSETAKNLQEEEQTSMDYGELEKSFQKMSNERTRNLAISLANRSITQRVEPIKSQLALQAYQLYTKGDNYPYMSSLYNAIHYATKSALGRGFNELKGHDAASINQIMKIDGEYQTVADNGQLIFWKDTTRGFTPRRLEERAKFFWNEGKMDILDFAIDRQFVKYQTTNKENKQLLSTGGKNFMQIDPSTDEIVEIELTDLDGMLLGIFPADLEWDVITTSQIVHVNAKDPEQPVKFSTIPLDFIAQDVIASRNGYYILSADQIFNFDASSNKMTSMGLSIGLLPTKIVANRALTTLAVGYASGEMDLFNLTDNTHKEKLIGHSSRLSALLFSANGKHLFSGGFDKAVNIWDMNSLRKDPIQLLDHVSFVTALHHDEDSNLLMVGEVNGTLKYYDLSSERNVKQLCSGTSGTLSQEDWTRYIGEDFEYDPYSCDQ